MRSDVRDGRDEEILRAIGVALGVRIGDFVTEDHLLEELGIDSIRLLEIAVLLEDTFEVEIPEEDLALIRTIGDLHDCVAGRL